MLIGWDRGSMKQNAVVIVVQKQNVYQWPTEYVNWKNTKTLCWQLYTYENLQWQKVSQQPP